MPSDRVITLTTDFGLSDHYVGVLKGVIFQIAPQAALIDISHEIAPQDIAAASFLLQSSFHYFPSDAIHLAVVDPGVGTSRAPVAIQSPHGLFVGPDNGIFSKPLSIQGVMDSTTGRLSGARAVVLENEDFRLHPVSQTFHGRDIFAPAAGYLAKEVPLESFGRLINSLIFSSAPAPSTQDGAIRGSVMYVDHFGIAISNIPLGMLPPTPIVEVAGISMNGLAENYQEATVVAIEGSSGYLEIAARNSRAAESLGLRVGDPIVVREGETATPS